MASIHRYIHHKNCNRKEREDERTVAELAFVTAYQGRKKTRVMEIYYNAVKRLYRIAPAIFSGHRVMKIDGL